MYSTVSNTKASGDISFNKFMNATMLNSGSGDVKKAMKGEMSKGDFDRSIFGASSGRFAAQTQSQIKAAELPGPGGYYGFGAGNYNPGSKETMNVAMNDARTLDE